jgi:hypothetical protein
VKSADALERVDPERLLDSLDRELPEILKLDEPLDQLGGVLGQIRAIRRRDLLHPRPAKLFQVGAANQQAYVRAENLWTHGRLQEVLHGGNASGSAIVTHASYGHRIPGFSRNWVRFVK